jgi:hypothetical protein
VSSSVPSNEGRSNPWVSRVHALLVVPFKASDVSIPPRLSATRGGSNFQCWVRYSKSQLGLKEAFRVHQPDEFHMLIQPGEENNLYLRRFLGDVYCRIGECYEKRSRSTPQVVAPQQPCVAVAYRHCCRPPCLCSAALGTALSWLRLQRSIPTEKGGRDPVRQVSRRSVVHRSQLFGHSGWDGVRTGVFDGCEPAVIWASLFVVDQLSSRSRPK